MMMIECSTRTTKTDDNHIEQNTERRRHWQCCCNLVSVYWRGTWWTTHPFTCVPRRQRNSGEAWILARDRRHAREFVRIPLRPMLAYEMINACHAYSYSLLRILDNFKFYTLAKATAHRALLFIGKNKPIFVLWEHVYCSCSCCWKWHFWTSQSNVVTFPRYGGHFSR